MNNHFIKELKSASSLDNFHFATNKIGNFPTSVIINDLGILCNFESFVPLNKSSLYTTIIVSFDKSEMVVSKSEYRTSVFIPVKYID